MFRIPFVVFLLALPACKIENDFSAVSPLASRDPSIPDTDPVPDVEPETDVDACTFQILDTWDLAEIEVNSYPVFRLVSSSVVYASAGESVQMTFGVTSQDCGPVDIKAFILNAGVDAGGGDLQWWFDTEALASGRNASSGEQFLSANGEYWGQEDVPDHYAYTWSDEEYLISGEAPGMLTQEVNPGMENLYTLTWNGSEHLDAGTTVELWLSTFWCDPASEECVGNNGDVDRSDVKISVVIQ